VEKKTLAVALPAPCPLACAFCRTPEHGDGDLQKVVQAVSAHLATGEYGEIHLTSNGETGLSPIFHEVVALAKINGVPISVLCATDNSIIPGLVRAEISLNKYTSTLAEKAIAKAKSLGIPVVISMVDTGIESIDPEKVTAKHDTAGALVRALQPEGRSNQGKGITRFFKKPDAMIGMFPCAAYAELKRFKELPVVDCIGSSGTMVPLLGSV
jgi:nucleotide-binding universal stress UspA family protein